MTAHIPLLRHPEVYCKTVALRELRKDLTEMNRRLTEVNREIVS
jgi:hypothetical protein